MKKLILLFACLLATPALANNLNQAIDNAEEKVKFFAAKWKEGFDDKRFSINNKYYTKCNQFSKKPSFSPKHSVEITKLIQHNGHKAKPFANDLFQTYFYDYTPKYFDQAMFSVFDEPSEIAPFCKDPAFSKGIIKAISAVIGKQL